MAVSYRLSVFKRQLIYAVVVNAKNRPPAGYALTCGFDRIGENAELMAQHKRIESKRDLDSSCTLAGSVIYH